MKLISLWKRSASREIRMSNNGPYTIFSEASKEPGHDKISLRQRIGRWLLKDKNRESLDQLHPSPVTISSDTPFSKDFSGWHIRIHKATNGHIVEAWRSNDGSYQTNRRDREHEMFLVSNEEDVLQELPHILTNLMLRG